MVGTDLAGVFRKALGLPSCPHTYSFASSGVRASRSSDESESYTSLKPAAPPSDSKSVELGSESNLAYSSNGPASASWQRMGPAGMKSTVPRRSTKAKRRSVATTRSFSNRLVSRWNCLGVQEGREAVREAEVSLRSEGASSGCLIERAAVGGEEASA